MTGSSVSSTAAHNDYLGIFEDDHNSSADFDDSDVVFGPTPRAGTLRNLFAQINTAPGAGGTWTITVNAGAAAPGAATAVTCQITGASATTCNSAALNAAVPAGSYVTVRVTRNPTSGVGTPGSKQWRFSFEY